MSGKIFSMINIFVEKQKNLCRNSCGSFYICKICVIRVKIITGFLGKKYKITFSSINLKSV